MHFAFFWPHKNVEIKKSVTYIYSWNLILNTSEQNGSLFYMMQIGDKGEQSCRIHAISHTSAFADNFLELFRLKTPLTIAMNP